MVEAKDIVNIDTIKQETEADKIDGNNGKINPHH